MGGSITPTVTLRTPLGTQFQYAWQNTLEVSKFDGLGVARDVNSLTNWTMSTEFSITQPLLKEAGIKVNTASVKIAQKLNQINILALRLTLIDSITSSILSFRNLLKANYQIGIDEFSLQRAKELVTLNENLVEVGRMARLDIVQTKTDVASKELDLLIARNNLDAARLDLITTLDIQEIDRIVPVEEFKVQPVKLEESLLTDIALKNNPAYLQSIIRVETNELNLMLAINNRLWDLSLTATHSTSASNENIRDTYRILWDEYNIDVSLILTIPIGDFTRKQRVIQARTDLQKAKYNMQEACQSLEIEVENRIRNVRISMKSVELAGKTRELSEKKLEVEKQKLNMGRTSNFELVRFQDDLVTAKNDELTTKIAYLNSLTLLDQVLGTTLNSWHVTVED